VNSPSVPYVSAEHQALTGRLYALNLRTGTFRIVDDARHSVRLTVPEDVRGEAAQLIGTRVHAIGRLRSMTVGACFPLMWQHSSSCLS